ncbi:MAG TPA: ferritin-like domain-containing protein [Holophagaceae bacterium]|jgi:hypothetical protein|nr:ferritin-like domain-containing protein [Holophagaceae bacterium]
MAERRTFLKTLAGGAALLGIGGLELPALEAADRGRAPSDVALLNTALELEHTAIYAYGFAAGSGLLSKGVAEVGGLFKGSHETHRAALTEAIKAQKGFPIAAKKSYTFAAFDLKTEGDILRLALFLEMGAAHAYHEALRQFRNKGLLDAAGRIMGDEVSHAAVLRGALGKGAVAFWHQMDEGFDG